MSICPWESITNVTNYSLFCILVRDMGRASMGFFSWWTPLKHYGIGIVLTNHIASMCLDSFAMVGWGYFTTDVKYICQVAGLSHRAALCPFAWMMKAFVCTTEVRVFRIGIWHKLMFNDKWREWGPKASKHVYLAGQKGDSHAEERSVTTWCSIKERRGEGKLSCMRSVTSHIPSED